MEKPINELLEFCIINVDKPAGITSFVCADRVRRILSAKKAGHFGTLDPQVTGVLPVAINRACKLAGYFMKKDKEYIGKMLIHKEISKEELKKEMKNFLGTIKQLPPRKSSVKRVVRERNVNFWELIEFKDKIATFKCDVEAGTYIRKLISDLGEKIGGAHMIELRRLRAGMFEVKDSHKLLEIKSAFERYKEGDETFLRNMLVPAEVIGEILPKIQIKDEAIKAILNGKPLMISDLKNGQKIEEVEYVCLFNGERFLGVYRLVFEEEIIGRAEFVLN